MIKHTEIDFVKRTVKTTLKPEEQPPIAGSANCCAALVEAYEAYINLLCDELNEVVPMAANHGWQTTRKESGEIARAKIMELKAQHNNAISKTHEI